MSYSYFISVSCPDITYSEVETLQASYEMSVALDYNFPILGREVPTGKTGYGFLGATPLMVEKLTALARNVRRDIHFFISYQNLTVMDFISITSSGVSVDQYEYQEFDLPNGQRLTFQVRPMGTNDITGMLAF